LRLLHARWLFKKQIRAFCAASTTTERETNALRRRRWPPHRDRRIETADAEHAERILIVGRDLRANVMLVQQQRNAFKQRQPKCGEKYVHLKLRFFSPIMDRWER
jgi:hypothetical protein